VKRVGTPGSSEPRQKQRDRQTQRDTWEDGGRSFSLRRCLVPRSTRSPQVPSDGDSRSGGGSGLCRLPSSQFSMGSGLYAARKEEGDESGDTDANEERHIKHNNRSQNLQGGRKSWKSPMVNSTGLPQIESDTMGNMLSGEAKLASEPLRTCSKQLAMENSGRA